MRKKILVFDGKNGEDGIVQSTYEAMMHALIANGLPNDELTSALAYKHAEEFREKWLKDIINEGISSDILSIITSTTKSNAVKACRNADITHEEFSSFVFISQNQNDFEHTLETKEFLPDGIMKEELPRVIHYEKGKDLYYEGTTSLTEKQLISVIKNRKRMHVHFFKNEMMWHCFYFTFSDMKGEHWQKSHLHYISSLWGFDLEMTKSNLLSSRRHKSLGEHIKYIPRI